MGDVFDALSLIVLALMVIGIVIYYEGCTVPPASPTCGFLDFPCEAKNLYDQAIAGAAYNACVGTEALLKMGGWILAGVLFFLAGLKYYKD